MSQHRASVRGRPPVSGKTKDEGSNSSFTIDDVVPSGWIKEIRPRKYGGGVKKDPFYIDPETGYAFRSKEDVKRYLKNKDISSCKIRPQKRDITTILAPSPTEENSELMRSEDFSTDLNTVNDSGDLKTVNDSGFAFHDPIRANLLEHEPLNVPRRTPNRLAAGPETEKLHGSGITEKARQTIKIKLKCPLRLRADAAVSMPPQNDTNASAELANVTSARTKSVLETDPESSRVLRSQEQAVQQPEESVSTLKLRIKRHPCQPTQQPEEAGRGPGVRTKCPSGQPVQQPGKAVRGPPRVIIKCSSKLSANAGS